MYDCENEFISILQVVNFDCNCRGILAPPHCLQYHKGTSGTIQNLGYNGNDTYQENLRYCICINRPIDTHCIKYTAEDFELDDRTVATGRQSSTDTTTTTTTTTTVTTSSEDAASAPTTPCNHTKDGLTMPNNVDFLKCGKETFTAESKSRE